MIRDLLERYPDPAQLAFALRNRADLCRSGETVEALIDHAAEIRGWNLARCRGLAELAVELTRKIEEPQGVALKARALAELGNAYRLSERLEEAREVFAEAEALLEEPLPPRRLAQIYFLLGAFYRDLRDYAPASAAEQAAASLFRQAGDMREETRALVLLGQIEASIRHFEQAHQHLLVAIQRLNEDPWDPDLLVTACGNVTYLYTEWAEEAPPRRRKALLDAALKSLEETRTLMEEHGHERRQLEYAWLLGRLLQESGRLLEAVEELEGLAERYFTAGYPRTAAMVALDLAECLLGLKRLDSARKLASHCLRIFKDAPLPSEVNRGLRIIALADTIEAAERGLRIAHRHRRKPAPVSDA